MQDRDPVSNGALVRPCGGPVPSAPPGWSWESLMRLALDEARQAAREDEVPVGAVLVAADAISNLSESPALSTRSFITNSAIGLRQMLPWQMKSTFVMSKYFLISYHFKFCTHACKIQFCFKNSRSTSSGRGVWFGYFSRSGAAAPSIM